MESVPPAKIRSGEGEVEEVLEEDGSVVMQRASICFGRNEKDATIVQVCEVVKRECN
jgi:hypothetical protein